LRYGLRFERFLHAAREAPLDIDIDLAEVDVDVISLPNPPSRQNGGFAPTGLRWPHARAAARGTLKVRVPLAAERCQGPTTAQHSASAESATAKGGTGHCRATLFHREAV
jgi:hypothetical protein